jgi:hypothetical protein
MSESQPLESVCIVLTLAVTPTLFESPVQCWLRKESSTEPSQQEARPIAAVSHMKEIEGIFDNSMHLEPKTNIHIDVDILSSNFHDLKIPKLMYKVLLP